MARYSTTTWRAVLNEARISSAMGTLKRMVENQEQKVTVPLVDSLAEHEVLENLLEESKPALLQPSLQQFDYLLRTPWRYPPLRWGSRFGRRFEPSLFYGALSDLALFAEAAYYRLVFLAGMQEPFTDRVISQFTVFEANYRSERSIDLSREPFVEHEPVLRHKRNYGPCQVLGTELRARGVEAISYLSARASGRAMNIALISPEALRSRKHRNPRNGICETRSEGVSFRLGDELHQLARSEFLYQGELPVPAI